LLWLVAIGHYEYYWCGGGVEAKALESGRAWLMMMNKEHKYIFLNGDRRYASINA
jgi:hypothetical protein